MTVILIRYAREEAPLTILNELLKTANLPIDIAIENDEQLFARKEGSEPYSIAELSDGERNAILITANVLTAPPGTLIIIDEPERHLHRSIVAPLLLSLFEKRDDCGFVISTHDVSLPVDSPESRTLLLRSCSWGKNAATAWDTDLLEPAVAISDDVKLSILGARRKMLFVEGTKDSLDKHIYTIIFPGISVVPSGNCIDVERAVSGVRSSAELHWVRGFGLIDKDDRSDEEVQGLENRGVYALDAHSVESLYYCDYVLEKIAGRQAQIADDLADLVGARQSIIDEVSPHRDRLCARLVERRARQAVATNLPTYESLQDDPVHAVTFDATGFIEEEQQLFDGLVAAGNNDGLVNRYPVRETGALGRVATRLGFASKAKFETAVRKLLLEDEEALEHVTGKLGTLFEAIEQ